MNATQRANTFPDLANASKGKWGSLTEAQKARVKELVKEIPVEPTEVAKPKPTPAAETPRKASIQEFKDEGLIPEGEPITAAEVAELPNLKGRTLAEHQAVADALNVRRTPGVVGEIKGPGKGKVTQRAPEPKEVVGLTKVTAEEQLLVDATEAVPAPVPPPAPEPTGTPSPRIAPSAEGTPPGKPLAPAVKAIVERKAAAKLTQPLAGVTVKKPLTDHTIPELDALIDKGDRLFDKKKLSEPDWVANLETIAKAKDVVRARGAANKAQEIVDATNEFGPVDSDAVKGIAAEIAQADAEVPGSPGPVQFPLLEKSLDELRFMQKAAKSIAGIEGHAMLEEVRLAIRAKKPLGEFDNASLEWHLKELRGMVQVASPGERVLLADRIAEVVIDQKQRTKPDPIATIVNNERGMVKFGPDPYPKPSNMPPHQVRIDEAVEWNVDPTEIPSLRSLAVQVRFLLERNILPLELATRVIAGKDFVHSFRNPGMLGQWFSGWPVRAENMLFHEISHWTPEGNLLFVPGVKPLAAIIAPLKGTALREFTHYDIATKVLEIPEGRPLPFARSDAVKLVEQLKDKYQKIKMERVAWRNEILKYGAAGGLYSDAMVQTSIDLYDSYAPLQRILEGRGTRSSSRLTISPKGVEKPKGVGAHPPAKRAKGSKLKVKETLTVDVDIARRTIRESDFNRIGLGLLDLARRFPERAHGVVQEVIDDSPFELNLKGKRIFKDLKEDLISRGKVVDEEALTALVDQWTGEHLNRDADKVYVYEGGKRVTLRVDPLIAQSLTSLQPKVVHWVLQLMAQPFTLPARVAKAGIVYNPMFPPLAALKDMWDASMRSRYGFTPLDSPRGLAHTLTGTKLSEGLLRSREWRLGQPNRQLGLLEHKLAVGNT
jgi:hypothetical protein